MKQCHDGKAQYESQYAMSLVLAVFQIAPWPGTREKCFLQGVGPAEVDGYAMVTWRILAA